MAAQNTVGNLTLGNLLPREALAKSISNLEISGLQLDSRKIQVGDLFIAVPGSDPAKPSDGRRFISEAVQAGASAVLAEAVDWPNDVDVEISTDNPASIDIDGSTPAVLIADLAKQISAIAGCFYGHPSDYLNVIGITGSNGKTTCAHLLAQLFNRLETSAATIGTLGFGAPKSGAGDDPARNTLTGTGLTTPDAVSCQKILADMLSDKVDTVAMEVSSHSLDQGRVSDIRMRGAVFTNFSRDHLDYHASMADYLDAKLKLFSARGLEFAVINIDDPAGVSLAESLHADIRCYTYSITDHDASVYAENIRLSAQGLEADVLTFWGRGRLKSRLIGEFNLSNMLAVITVACASGLKLDAVLAAVEALAPVPGRLEVIRHRVGPMVVIDYAHTPDALAKALTALRFADNSSARSKSAHGKSPSGKLWCVFGCGGDRDKGKRPEMAAAAEQLADEVVVTSDNPRNEAPAAIIDDILSGTDQAFHRYEDRAKAIRFAIDNADPADTVLIAGKGHEDYQITGENRLPFSDAAEARLALQRWGDARE